MKWLYSFLTADKRKTYCLYQAANPDLIRKENPRGTFADHNPGVSCEQYSPDL